MYEYLEITDPEYKSDKRMPLQNCPSCGVIIGAMSGGRDAVCKNCGYKDPCCE